MLKTIAALALVSIFTGAQTAPSAPTVTGQWTLEAPDGPHGAMTLGLKCDQKGRDVSATLNIPHLGDVSLQGVFADRKLSLKAKADSDTGITLSATLKEDGTLTGFISSERGDVTWTGKRTGK